MEKLTKPVVQLRIYKGSEKAFNGKGEVLNENQKVTLTYNTLEWNNYFKYIAASGFGIIEVEACYVNEKEVEVSDEIQSFIDNVFKTPEKELTADQKRIADLEAKIDALSKKEAKEPKAPKAETK